VNKKYTSSRYGGVANMPLNGDFWSLCTGEYRQSSLYI
jgi:hypothetical protein